MCIEVFNFLIAAIRLSGGRVYSDLLSLLETFIKCDRLHEALNLYSTLMNKYPQVSELFFLYKFVMLYLFPYISLYFDRICRSQNYKGCKSVSFYACMAR